MGFWTKVKNKVKSFFKPKKPKKPSVRPKPKKGSSNKGWKRLKDLSSGKGKGIDVLKGKGMSIAPKRRPKKSSKKSSRGSSKKGWERLKDLASGKGKGIDVLKGKGMSIAPKGNKIIPVEKMPISTRPPSKDPSTISEDKKGLLEGTWLDPKRTQEAFGETEVGAKIQQWAVDRGISPTGNEKMATFTVPSVMVGVKPGSKELQKALGLTSKGAKGAKAGQIAKEFGLKVFSPKTMAILGSAVGAMFLGMWGQAESGEPLSIVMRDVIKEAERTGNWTLYEEAREAREEVTTLEAWEELGLWTPISPFIGITNKIKGAIAAGKVQDQLAEDLQVQQETGESEAEKWARVKEQQAQQEKELIDYYNESRKQQLIWEQEARMAGLKEEAAFWAAEREKQRKKEEEDRIALAEFWLAYRREAAKIKEESRPSNLKFGLL